MLKVNMLPRGADLDNVQTGMYVLNKQLNGLDAKCLAGACIAGVDPGRRSYEKALPSMVDAGPIAVGHRRNLLYALKECPEHGILGRDVNTFIYGE
ncbi:hypothetical protein K492DRAFT_198456 [Lichtheimia hyalospora FSU 10163]|nr:hypothetical protein K492DRAFT_198456 [Lichtheimia hyalospora FSU 10163]